MLPESLSLPQPKIRNFPSPMSAFKRRVIERNIPYSRALIHNGQAYSVYTPKGAKGKSFPLQSKPFNLTVYSLY